MTSRSEQYGAVDERGSLRSGEARSDEPGAQAEFVGERIARMSPEGRPAHPLFGGRQMALMLAALMVLLLLAGVIVGLAVDPALGIGIAALGVVLLLVNPELWASVFRARERSRVRREVRGEGDAGEERAA